jgi:hypothetical protein
MLMNQSNLLVKYGHFKRRMLVKYDDFKTRKLENLPQSFKKLDGFITFFFEM